MRFPDGQCVKSWRAQVGRAMPTYYRKIIVRYPFDEWFTGAALHSVAFDKGAIETRFVIGRVLWSSLMPVRGLRIGLVVVGMLAGAHAIAAPHSADAAVSHAPKIQYGKNEGLPKAAVTTTPVNIREGQAAGTRSLDNFRVATADKSVASTKSVASAMSKAAGWAMIMLLGSAVMGFARSVDVRTLARITV